MSVRRVVRALSPRAEFWLIVVLSFGYFIAASIAALLLHRAHPMSDWWAALLVLHELVVLTIVAWIARERGWSFSSLGLDTSLRFTGGGLLLYVGSLMALGAIYVTVVGMGVDVPRPNFAAGRVTWIAVIAVCLVNPFFEEVLVAGYVVNATSRHGTAFAVTASALIRFLYHTYQGPVAAVSILPIGIIFAAVYARYRQLWPLIVAHALMDFAALSRLASASWPR